MLILILLIFLSNCNCNILEVQQSESRQFVELSGFWEFKIDNSSNRNLSFEEKWYSRNLADFGPTIKMPICSSFNDIATNFEFQYFVGWVWYQKSFYFDISWIKKRIVLLLESAHYNTIVWLNGIYLMGHSGGHLPFEAEVNKLIRFNQLNRIIIAINNTLTPHTLPTGSINYPKNPEMYPPGYFTQTLQFDFFNYAGVHRQVYLYTTPSTYISDITIVTNDIIGKTGFVDYKIEINSTLCEYDDDKCLSEIANNSNVSVEIYDSNNTLISQSDSLNDRLTIDTVKLWWPYTLAPKNFGYLYTIKININEDVYRQSFGFRTVKINDESILINNRRFYCLGVGKHEDQDIKGKGLDLSTLARDFHMLKWLGVNCVRTSHYPYAREFHEMADREGIVVIGEAPAVGLKSDENYSNETLSHHLDVMKEMILRDKNHPAIIMWSLANEPDSSKLISRKYFEQLFNLTRSLDATRLAVIIISNDVNSDIIGDLCDVICINRYYGWYEDTGHVDAIHKYLESDILAWRKKHGKPIIVSEFGADTIVGVHSIPPVIFTEDYQTQLLHEFHQVFDEFLPTFLTGEMVWNYADFMTDQSLTRAYGNRKGLLTRQRQPKMAAYLIRKRYHQLAQNLSIFT